jgi:hypothetical protein
MDIKEQVKRKIQNDWFRWRDNKYISHLNYLMKLEYDRKPYRTILRSKLNWYENQYPAILTSEIQELLIEQILRILIEHPQYTLNDIPPIHPDRVLDLYKIYKQDSSIIQSTTLPNFIAKPYTPLEKLEKEINDERIESAELIQRLFIEQECLQDLINNNQFPIIDNYHPDPIPKSYCEKLLNDNIKELQEQLRIENDRIKKLEEIQTKILEEKHKEEEQQLRREPPLPQSQIPTTPDQNLMNQLQQLQSTQPIRYSQQPNIPSMPLPEEHYQQCLIKEQELVLMIKQRSKNPEEIAKLKAKLRSLREYIQAYKIKNNLP